MINFNSTTTQTIIDRLNRDCTNTADRPNWKKEVFNALEEVLSKDYSNKNDCKFAYSGNLNFRKEWLYDFTCFDFNFELAHKDNRETSSYSIRTLNFIAEIEWEMNFEDNILPDFEKLVVSGAYNRTMIFRAENESESEHVFNCLDDVLTKYTSAQKGTCYIYLASLNSKAGHYNYRVKTI